MLVDPPCNPTLHKPKLLTRNGASIMLAAFLQGGAEPDNGSQSARVLAGDAWRGEPRLGLVGPLVWADARPAPLRDSRNPSRSWRARPPAAGLVQKENRPGAGRDGEGPA